MLECAHAHISISELTRMRRASHFARLAKIKGNPKAAVAAASKLLKIVYWVMKEKGKYHYHS